MLQLFSNIHVKSTDHQDQWIIEFNRSKDLDDQCLFGSFPKIHPFWYPDPSLRLLWLLGPSSKCVLFWFFSIQLLKTLNPEITFVYPFHAQKVPQICNINSWIENDPLHPPLVLFRKFIRFGSWTLPLEYYDYKSTSGAKNTLYRAH